MFTALRALTQITTVVFLFFKQFFSELETEAEVILSLLIEVVFFLARRTLVRMGWDGVHA